ncbi:MAG: hypothetical protein H0V70_00375 [Ktedonobacteraceae bacterium]|nr:hypothetical protein [Ktedonobacteraceae bacterium]
MIVWSDDCFSCLCNFPHTMEAHMQAVNQAHDELLAELQEFRLLYADLLKDDLECDDQIDDM